MTQPTRKQRVVNTAFTVGKWYIGFRVSVLVCKALGRVIFGSKKQTGDGDQQAKPGKASSPAEDAVAMVPGDDSWHVMPEAPPPVPAGFNPMVTLSLPAGVSEFYQKIVSSRSNFFLDNHKSIGGQYNMSITPWQTVQKSQDPASPGAAPTAATSTPTPVFDNLLHAPPGSFTRILRFSSPKKPPAMVDAQCVQRQAFGVYAGNVMLFTTVMNMVNIPFKDCFCVKTWWEIKPNAGGASCTATLYLHVHFVKGCLMRGLINATTVRDATPFYQAFISSAAKHLSGAAPDADAATHAAVALPVTKGVSSINDTSALAAGGQGIVTSGGVIPRNVASILALMLYVCILLHQLYLGSQVGALQRSVSWCAEH